MPVAGVHVFLAHVESPAALQVTMVAALMTHVWLESWQTNVPSQRLPFSSGPQSASFWHWQVLAPPTQTPAAHVSPCVQVLPSSHAAVLLVCVHPVAELQASVVHGLLSLQVVATLTAAPAHPPPAQVSFCVQASPSLQPKLLLAKTQPVFGLHESLVHTLLSAQVIALPLQSPAAQVSPDVHALPSLQPAVLNVCRQPDVASQLSSVHGLPSPHDAATLMAVPEQTPPPQTSPDVQRLLSLQPIALFTCVQPVAASQASLVQGLPSSQPIAAPAHLPMLQMSPAVHALPSSQAPPALKCVHAPVVKSQPSAVQALLSLQSLLLPARHALAAQTSLTVHGLPSLQGRLLAVWTQPLVASHASSVHGLLSSHAMFTPATHVPFVHESPLVQTEPSASQAPPSLVATALQRPVAGAHVLTAQAVSPAALQVTTVAGLTVHVWVPS